MESVGHSVSSGVRHLDSAGSSLGAVSKLLTSESTGGGVALSFSAERNKTRLLMQVAENQEAAAVTGRLSHVACHERYTAENSTSVEPPSLVRSGTTLPIAFSFLEDEKEEDEDTTIVASRPQSKGSLMRLDRKLRIMIIRQLSNPLSRFNVIMKMLGSIFVLVDLTLTPFMLAWDYETTDVFLVFAWCSTLYWTVDLLVSFQVGYFVDGKLVANRWLVARRYLLTWFAVDVLLVGSDWWSTLAVTLRLEDSGGTTSMVKVARSAKLGKFVRVMVLLRALRVLTVIQDWLDAWLSTMVHSLFSMLKVIGFTFWATHLMACGWFAVGRHVSSDTGHSWVQGYDGNTSGFAFYVVSFQWAMAQMTMGATDITCMNTPERLFNTLCLLVGLAASSILVSFLSAGMVDAHMSASERLSKIRTLQSFLRDNVSGRSPMLSQVVIAHVRESLNERARLHESDVSVLGLLPKSLRSRLRFEILGPTFLLHPLFRFVHSTASFWCQEIAIDALESVHVQAKDELFLQAKPALGAYCVTRGLFSYCRTAPKSSKATAEYDVMVDSETWLSLPALWLTWRHEGRSQALERSEALLVHAQRLFTAVHEQDVATTIVRVYATVYCRAFFQSADATDLKVDGTDWEDLVFGFDDFWRREVSVAALKELQNQIGHMRLYFTGLHSKLSNDIEADKCMLVVGSRGVERLVEVVTFSLQRESRTLMCLGRIHASGVEASCLHPGGKRKYSELLTEAALRLLGERLGWLEENLEIDDGMAPVVETTRSETSGVVTVYRRVVFRGAIEGQLEQPYASAASGSSIVSRIMSVGGPQSWRPLGTGTVPDWAVEMHVYFSPDERGGHNAFALLDDSEVQYLKSERGKKDLAAWLSVLTVPVVASSQDALSSSMGVTTSKRRLSHVSFPGVAALDSAGQAEEAESSMLATVESGSVPSEGDFFGL